MRFFDVMRGTRIAPPNKLLPVIKMPLHSPNSPMTYMNSLTSIAGPRMNQLDRTYTGC